MSVLWQLYRPLLGNTVEITTGGNSNMSSLPFCNLLWHTLHGVKCHSSNGEAS